MTDTTRTITRSALRFFSGTFLSRLTGLARDVAMAFAFGTHPSVAAFLTAFRLAHLFRRLLGEGAMQTAFIPQFEKLKSVEPSRAINLFLDLRKYLTLSLLLLISLITFLLWPLLAHQEIAKLTLLMLPSLLFICLFGINASFLQCHGHYFTPSVAPCLFNFLWIATLFFLFSYPVERAMVYLSLGINGACLAQWLMTEREVRQLYTAPKIRTHDLKLLLSPLLLSFVGVASTQVNSALDTLFARFAEGEGPAYLWYAIRVQQLPLALFGIALSSALLPPLTRSKGNPERFCHFLHFGVERALMLMVPITVYLFLLGEGCIRVIYERGSFTSLSTRATAECLWAYGFGLVPMALILLFNPALNALGDYRSGSRASLVAVGMNVFLNALLVFVLGYGAFSVALATSVSAWWQGYYLYLVLRRHLSFSLPSLWGIVGYTFLGVLAYELVKSAFPNFFFLSVVYGLPPAYYLLKSTISVPRTA